MKLLKILLELYKEEYDLNIREGLTKTTNIGKSINIIQNQYPNVKVIKNKENNTFILTNIDQSFLPPILKLINNLGWFPSWVNSPFYNGKYFKGVEINYTSKIRFEAKYDENVENIPTLLYHISPSENTPKIYKKGLSPKSRSKASYHPDRVYLLKDSSQAEELADLFYQKTGQNIWDLLEINTTLIPGEYLKLYKDPNYDNGYYTLNNIPPQAIKIVKKIFT